jgi:putative sterol carrier protein
MNAHTIDDRPLSEKYRLVAKQWVQADAAARILEETKSAVLAQRMAALGDKPAAHAERDVKASPEWSDFITGMVDARTAANLARVKLKYIEMKAAEQQSKEATKRAEMKL